MASKTLKSRILKIVSNARRGLTVSEIHAKVTEEMIGEDVAWYNRPETSSVRGRVYELARDGRLSSNGARKSPVTNTLSTIYTKYKPATRAEVSGCGGSSF